MNFGVIGPTRVQVFAAMAVCCGAMSLQCPMMGGESMAADPLPAKMAPYSEAIGDTNIQFKMVPIPGGEYVMGSPETEAGRKADEGPQHPVKIEPFWMGATEVTWDEYDIWAFSLDVYRRKLSGARPNENDHVADLVTRPTRPYTDMSFGMGQEGHPASA